MKPTIEIIQKAILSNKKYFQGFALPTVQKGNFFRQNSHSLLLARRFYEQYFSNTSCLKRENKEQLFQRMLNNFETL